MLVIVLKKRGGFATRCTAPASIFVGVKEDGARHGKPDCALKKVRALHGGKDGSPVNKHAAGNYPRAERPLLHRLPVAAARGPRDARRDRATIRTTALYSALLAALSRKEVGEAVEAQWALCGDVGGLAGATAGHCDRQPCTRTRAARAAHAVRAMQWNFHRQTIRTCNTTV